jgi:uncharacterized protein
MKTIELNKKLKEEIIKDKKVIAVFIYGSYSRGEKNYGDIDICVVLDKKYSGIEMSRKRVKLASLSPANYDIHIFQQLPVYIRKRILKEGKLLECKNENQLYEIAFQTIKEFGLYEKLYNLYLDKVKNG